MATAALARFWLGLPAAVPEQLLEWWMLLGMFCAAEIAVVHLYFDRDSRSFSSFSLGEIPLTIALVFGDPGTVLWTRLLAITIAMIIQGNRDPLKFVFNQASYAFETTAAVLVFHVVMGSPNPLSPFGWFAIFSAVAAATVLGTSAVPLAICISQGQWQLQRLGRLVGLSLIGSVTNTSLGLLAVTVLFTDARAIWLLVQVAMLLFVAYRGYTSLREKHETLALLRDFTQEVGSSLEAGRTSLALLDQVRKLLRAEQAEIVLLPHSAGGEATRLVLGKGEVVPRVEKLRIDLGSTYARVLHGSEALLITANTRDPAEAEFLSARRMKDAMLVPLRSEGEIFGLLIIGSRLGDVEKFGHEDLRLFETVANHASVLLRNERLVDRLRQEVDEKEHQASHDALTGLPNRTLFNDRVQQAILKTRKTGGKVAVMLLDLDRFKEVNDTLGHHIGDELLMEVGARLLRTMQRQDTVARLGGDEFAILLPTVEDEETARQVAERARRALEQPFELGHITLIVGASIGIAISPDHGDMATGLLQRADVAMYAAKGEHNSVEVYSAVRDEYSPRRLALVAELRTALDRGEIDVHYQPKADLRTGKIVGVEALVRWCNPERGLISPDEFIPIAERTGLIHPLTTHVIQAALHQCREWRRSGRKIDMAVNLSVGSLLNLELPGEISRLLIQAGVAPSSLTLEITESSIMADPTRSVQVLGALHAMGIRLAIDDFGTGYSSLSHLKRLPVDELKIDKSFVLNMASDDNDAVIVRSTVDLGHNLGLRVVAEGVEDTETWKRLAALGCDIAQGYYLGRAMGSPALDDWLVGWDKMLAETRGVTALDSRRPGEADAVEGVPDLLAAPDRLQ